VSANKQSWFVYLLRCSDTSLYTGITTDIARRLQEHNHGDKGAKFTRGRRPVSLVYHEKYASRSQASRREYQIKRLSKEKKEQMLRDFATSEI